MLRISTGPVLTLNCGTGIQPPTTTSPPRISRPGTAFSTAKGGHGVANLAATKALDGLYQVDPPPAARKIRELLYSAFMVEDHALHFFFLGGPDFIVGPAAPPQTRNILGVVDAVGLEVGKEVIGVRKQLRDLVAAVAGKAIHPVFGLPGGVARPLSGEAQWEAAAAAARAIEFSQFALGAFRTAVLGNPATSR